MPALLQAKEATWRVARMLLYRNPAMTISTLLIWAVIGLIAGWLASQVVGGGYGLVGDIIVGVVGAFIGGLIFGQFDITVPFAGLAGTIFVAFVGAVVLLVLLRLIVRNRTRSVP
jgi:uncharacterized membrane protein YeaQ/YmgE (transglycosylase-associated protein family)